MSCVRIQRGCPGQGSNSRPSGLKSDAVTTEPPRLPLIHRVQVRKSTIAFLETYCTFAFRLSWVLSNVFFFLEIYNFHGKVLCV